MNIPIRQKVEDYMPGNLRDVITTIRNHLTQTNVQTNKLRSDARKMFGTQPNPLEGRRLIRFIRIDEWDLANDLLNQLERILNGPDPGRRRLEIQNLVQYLDCVMLNYDELRARVVQVLSNGHLKNSQKLATTRTRFVIVRQLRKCKLIILAFQQCYTVQILLQIN